jgi:hypothetical protein
MLEGLISGRLRSTAKVYFIAVNANIFGFYYRYLKFATDATDHVVAIVTCGA